MNVLFSNGKHGYESWSQHYTQFPKSLKIRQVTAGNTSAFTAIKSHTMLKTFLKYLKTTVLLFAEILAEILPAAVVLAALQICHVFGADAKKDNCQLN